MTGDVGVTFRMNSDGARYECDIDVEHQELRIFDIEIDELNGSATLTKNDIEVLKDFLVYIEEHKYNV